MEQEKKLSPKFLQRRKFLVTLPVLIVPFLCLTFYALGGGSGEENYGWNISHRMGFNMELPPAVIDKKEDKMDKLAFYKKADEDSVRKKELLQRDPYHHREKVPAFLMPARPSSDTAADGLLRKLDLLKRQLAVQGTAGREKPSIQRVRSEPVDEIGAGRSVAVVVPQRKADSPAIDPELEKLNEMLDKIARLQHGDKVETLPEKGVSVQTGGVGHGVSQEVSIAIPATVENDQELMNGATLAMRLTAAVSLNGMTIPRGQLVYGMVAMNNDRMQVGIHSIRCGESIVTTSWQVYDLDGLQGIRIPDGLGRQVARQSADQGIGSLNLANYDPSIGGQVAGAGIQAAKSLLSRKVRMVRVMVPAGYQVLIRDTRMGSAGSIGVMPDTGTMRVRDSMEAPVRLIVPPAVDSLEPFLHESTSEGKVHLTLRGIYQREGVIWLYLVVHNKSHLTYSPDHLECSIRQDKRLRRMAVQELAVETVYDSLPSKVGCGDSRAFLLGLKAFTFGKDKSMVLQIWDKGGGKELTLKIKHGTWLKAN